MTEAEWNVCTNAQEMIRFVRTKASDRKLRLYVCASCRCQNDDLIREKRIETALDVAERFADRAVHESEYAASCEGIQEFMVELVAEQDFIKAARVRDYRRALVYQNSARAIATRIAGQRTVCGLLHDLFGPLPFRPSTLNSAWLTSTVTQLAASIYAERAFDRLPILADALMDAGCGDTDILKHCRQASEHVRGCWVVDLLLGKR